MQREEAVQIIQQEEVWDLVVIGGGATGLGTALDAAQRGFRTLLLEKDDFGKGTSSRSTKLVHGGVRYLRQGNVQLVFEALRERARLLRNAPHLVHRQAFLIPCYSVWQRPYYRVGLGFYDRLAGRESFGRSRSLSTEESCQEISSLLADRLRGGVLYYDGQFDDARLAITLALTAHQQGATLLNYARVTGLRKSGSGITDVEFDDTERGQSICVQSKAVVNATGIFVDELRRQAEPEATSILAHSQGVHLVLDYEWLGGKTALMIPRTEDGRVLFAIPWNGKVVVGTTDTPVDHPSAEPRAQEAELDFLVKHVAKYVGFQPDSSDVRSVFVGIRPLVKPARGSRNTKRISREHVIEISPSGLITVTGGKWTTYRKMAADTVDQVIQVAGWEHRPCGTAHLPLYGYDDANHVTDDMPSETSLGPFVPWNLYGSDARKLEELVAERPELQELIHPELPYQMAEVVWGARHEMARTLEDVLARRTRCLLLDSRATLEAAPRVAAVLAEELRRDSVWAESQLVAFRLLADGYRMP